VSSEGLIFLVKANFFNQGESVREITELALWLHLGTFLAALVYFRKDVLILLRALVKFGDAGEDRQRVLIFLVIATLISGLVGVSLLLILTEAAGDLNFTTKAITLIIGILLLITAGLQFKAKKNGLRNEKDIKNKDSVLLGLMQGLAALPGLSRSGLTVSALLLRKFNEALALRLSFLLSLPIVLGGNIVLNLDKMALNPESLIGLLASFVFGLLTIGALLKIAKKVNFGWFVLGFGILTLLSVLI